MSGDPGKLTALEASAQALNLTVDQLSGEDLRAPSVLPGWSRAHVVAHVALNGEALAGVLDAAAHARPAVMYPSPEERDADIAELAAAQPQELRDRLLAATTEFADAVARMSPEHWDATFDRVPGGPTLPVGPLVATRRREVEIHHADLGAAYLPADWPEDFVVGLLDELSNDRSDAGPFRIRATDLDREWSVGSGEGPLLLGSGHHLAWWLAGRGGGEGLLCESGSLPELGRWR